jgi:catechol 2,3-dioxygenase-like lactoylglutathione lyase family enzyme
MVTTNAHNLHKALLSRGLTPAKVTQGSDGDKRFRLHDPDGNILEFVEYVPGSQHSNTRGKFATPERISTHLWGVGLPVGDVQNSLTFYRNKLGFREVWRHGSVFVEMPGSRGDRLELVAAGKKHLNRKEMGQAHHLVLEVLNLKGARTQLAKHNMPQSKKTDIVDVADSDGFHVYLTTVDN